MKSQDKESSAVSNKKTPSKSTSKNKPTKRKTSKSTSKKLSRTVKPETKAKNRSKLETKKDTPKTVPLLKEPELETRAKHPTKTEPPHENTTKERPQNTKTYNNPVSLWDFRASVETVSFEQIQTFLKSYTKHWIFQKEEGEQTQYTHFQGRFSLIKRKRKSELMNLFLAENLAIPNYLEPTSNNSFGSWFYVLKKETRIEGPWKNTDEEYYLPIHLRGVLDKPYPYQQQIIDSAKINDSRTVNVIYDPKGCTGKSTVAAWCSATSDAISVPPCGKAQEIVQYVCSLCMQKQIRNPGLIFVDIPRAISQASLDQIYAAIEIIKSGVLYDMRFSAKRWTIDSPSIWVFSNVEPDCTLLSKDRWKIWRINDKKELVLASVKGSLTT
jgi:hypothetical protein